MPSKRDCIAVAVLCFVVYVVLTRHYTGPSNVNYLPITAPLPTYFKYKQNLLMPITNQQQCAACWSFSIVAMMADTLNIKSAGAYGYEPLSAQYLLNCSTAHLGCSVGGSPEDMYNL